MRRAVERFLENQMAEEILQGTIKDGDHIKVTRGKRKLPGEKNDATERSSEKSDQHHDALEEESLIFKIAHVSKKLLLKES
jgi:hypothetical protein